MPEQKQQMSQPQGQKQIQNEEVAELFKFIANFLNDMEGSKINKYSINGFWMEANQHFIKLEDVITNLKNQQSKKESK